MDLKDWSVAISAFVAACAYWAKTRHERRRATRTALYYLLELHYLVHRLLVVAKAGPEPLVRQITAALKKHGRPVTDAESEEATKGFQPLIQVFIQTRLDELSVETREPFAKALADLAKEDPILAFKLRGRDKLLTLSQNLQSMMQKASLQAPASVAGMDAYILKEAASDLDHALKTTAWRCDIFTHVLVWLRLRKVAFNKPGELEEFYEELAEQAVAAMKAAERPKITA